MSTIEKALKKRNNDGTSESLHENVSYMPGVDPDSLSDEQDDEANTEIASEEPYIDFFEEEAICENIGQILLEQGKLREKDIEKVLKLQERKDLFFGDAAIKLKLLSAEDINSALSKQFGYDYISEPPTYVSKEIVVAHKPFSKQAEAIRGIRSQLLTHFSAEHPRHVLAIVSPNSNEGRSYVAANLAVAFSQMGKKTLLIDADLRRPRQHTLFGFGRKLGLSSMLAGRIEADKLSDLPNSFSHFPNLAVLGAGPVPPNPSELLANARMRAIVDEISRHFDMVILDSPAGQFRSDAQSVCSVAESALLVTRRDKTGINDTKELLNIFSRSNVTVVGAILNEF